MSSRDVHLHLPVAKEMLSFWDGGNADRVNIKHAQDNKMIDEALCMRD